MHIITISANDKIYDLITKYPIIKEIMQEIGFSSITSVAMLNTVGRVMTLNSGSKMRNIDIQLIKDKFLIYNFILEDINNE